MQIDVNAGNYNVWDDEQICDDNIADGRGVLLFYVLVTSKAISGLVPTCNSVHSWRIYSVTPLGEQATRTMTRYPTQSHYLDTEPTSPFPTLIMQST